MKRFLTIVLMLMCICVCAQDVKITFVKSNHYKCTVSFNQQTFVLGYDNNGKTIKTVQGSNTWSFRLFSHDMDTTVNGTFYLQRDTTVNFDHFLPLNMQHLDEVEIFGDAGSVFGKNNLRQVEGFAIYAGKKTEVISLKQSKANLAINNGRQVYAKIAGLNIWESDAGGIQLGIGGRGLSPNRTSNFNTRQNGYDISADALGYPESYYSPVPDMVDRIEVVRGASSLQYGTQFGGLVNFKMKRAVADNRLHGMVNYTGGSFDFYNLSHQLSYGTRQAGIFAAHQYKTGSGFRNHSGFDHHSAFVNAYFNIKHRLSIGIDFTKMYYLAQQPGGLTDELFYKDPYTVLRKRNWFKVNWNLAAVYADYYITEKTKINTRFFGLISDRKNVGFLGQINRPDLGQPREILAGTFKNFGNETRLLSHYKVFKQHHTLLLGVRYYQGQTTAQQGLAARNNSPDFNFLHPDNIDYSDYVFPSRNIAVFAENIFRLTDKISVTPGMRYENINTKSDGYFYTRSFDLAGDTLLELKNTSATENKRQFVLGGVGLSYKPFAWMEVIANFSQNYRAINFSDIAIVNPNFKVDPGIRDESGYTADIGLRGAVKKWLSYDVSGFFLKYNNRIGEIFKRDDFSYIVIRYRTNIGDSYNYGVESFAEIDPVAMINDSSKWSIPVFVNYSFIQAFYNNNNEKYVVGGNRVEFVPQHMLRTGITIQYGGFYINGNYSWLSEQFSDATNAIKTTNAIYGLIPAYWVADASVGVKIKSIKASLHVNNFTNNFYFTRRATGYPGPGIIPSEPRTFYMSVGLSF